ncbi:MAG: acyl-CoA dehydrogenase family protein [Desulfurellaceae bacterium]|nr:acyl-CoA dehydrogenase family protein [Desulfurellaceae bacterium]
MALVFCEELCRCHALGLPMSVLVHTDMSTTHIARYGTPQQKDKYLRPLISGEQVCAVAVSEPSGGSNVGPRRGWICPQWGQDFHHQLGPCRHLLCGGQNRQRPGP